MPEAAHVDAVARLIAKHFDGRIHQLLNQKYWAERHIMLLVDKDGLTKFDIGQNIAFLEDLMRLPGRKGVHVFRGALVGICIKTGTAQDKLAILVMSNHL